MKIQLLKNIIFKSEANELTSWIKSNKDKDFFVWSGHPGTIRRTTRFSKNVVYPHTAFVIKDRIMSKLNINTNFYPDYPFGMVASYGIENDECSIHRDPVWYENHITYHCVLLLSKPKTGGVPILGEKLYPMDELDTLCYPVSEIDHGTTAMTGNIPRILWIFGFSIPKVSYF